MVSARSPLAFVAALAIAPTLLFACNVILGVERATQIQDAGTADAAVDAAQTACQAYCATIEKNCTGENREYISPEICVAMCARYEPGVPGDQSNDSLACRMLHATRAATDPSNECSQAGPLATGPCNSNPCGPFCLLTFSLCNPISQFPFDGGEQGCRAECSKFPYISADAGDAAAGDILYTTGNTLNCRLYHLESAFDPNNPSASLTHCPHTATISAPCN
jgi:hypothetical protein